MPPTPANSAQNDLLEAGLRLLAQGSKAADLEPLALTVEAGLQPAAYAESYPGPHDYLLALFDRLLDEARDAATGATVDQPAGTMGLKRGIEAYLDVHLRRPALRELTLLLREGAAGQAMIQRRMAGFHRVLQVGFSTLHASFPLGSAQLVTILTVETCQAEYEAQTPLPELRETLYAYIERLVP